MGDPRKKRLRYQCWHRGMKEVDLILGRFVDAHLEGLSESETDSLEALLAVPDQTLFNWFSGREEVAEEHHTPLFIQIRAFCGTFGPAGGPAAQ